MIKLSEDSIENTPNPDRDDWLQWIVLSDDDSFVVLHENAPDFKRLLEDDSLKFELTFIAPAPMGQRIGQLCGQKAAADGLPIFKVEGARA